MFCWRKKSVPKSDAKVLFIFIALVGTLVLSAAVIGIGSRKRGITHETPRAATPRDALPADLLGAVNSVSVPSMATPTEIFSYWSDNGPRLGLVQWEAEAGTYRLVSYLPLVGEPAFVATPEIAMIDPRWGSGVAVKLTGLTVGGDEVISFVRYANSRLMPVTIERAAGVRRVENFTMQKNDVGRSGLTVEDLDGDRIAEVVLAVTNADKTTVTDVFSWAGNRLVRNDALSAAMTARAGLFPETAGAE